MALPASIALASSLNFQVKLFGNRPSQLHRCSQSQFHPRYQISPMCFMGVTMPYFGEPSNEKGKLRIIGEQLWEAVPVSIKNFPWKKAENILLERLLFLGKDAMKWFLVTYFFFSFLSDVIVSIFRNQELMIPFGLLVGCLMTDFLKVTSQEVFPSSEETDLSWHLLGIGCFYVLLKLISLSFAVQGPIFLLHVSNGGLMQVLWLWRNFLKENVVTS
ncbi:hypothetical protein CFOL_v3_01541 [Cephalotus follicularis]|uniref:Uncharacterized protein n=1 Tax=Cephalotus follicularis TaxID=3775 RepID=A0A1Q3AQR4_CEPFO|nr:hypothetical protein CFOL_v3_01541 [Cephalotus follicularis]